MKAIYWRIELLFFAAEEPPAHNPPIQPLTAFIIELLVYSLPSAINLHFVPFHSTPFGCLPYCYNIREAEWLSCLLVHSIKFSTLHLIPFIQLHSIKPFIQFKTWIDFIYWLIPQLVSSLLKKQSQAAELRSGSS